MNKYNTIYIDPPWKTKAGRPLNRYTLENGKQIWAGVSNQSRDLPYPTMTLEDIADLPVGDLAASNAHLYMWVINQYLPDAFGILKSWGFKHSTVLVWAKKPMGGGLGGAYRITTEFLLYARRGKLPTKKTVIGTCFNQKREYDERGKPQHSRKPEFFAELIESVSPGPYLEMFARRHRAGWDVWGNEVDGIEIASNSLINK